MKIGLMLPGYGSQFVGMGKELYDEFRIIQEFFEEASICLNTNFVKLCFASSDAELARIQNAYPALFLVSCAIVALLKQEGVTPSLVAGFNQGEYAALFAAGGIIFPDGLYLLNKYAQLYQDALVTMSVAAVRIKGVDTQTLEDACLKATAWTDEQVSIAVYEPFNVHVVTGNQAGIEHLRQLLGGQDGVTFDYAPVEMGLHSSLMDPLVDQLRMYLEKIDFKNLSVPLCEAQNGRLVEHHHEVKEIMVKQINHPIMWQRVVDALLTSDIILEIGPGSVLTDMIKHQYPDKKIFSVNKRADIEAVKELIRSQPLDGDTNGNG